MSDFALHGDNAHAFNSKEPEVLLAGPAGTGKSLAWLLKIFTVCNNYPGARCLIARKTRESLTESVLVTWERDVLAPGTLGHTILTKNPTLRRVRQSYRFPNGSTVVVGGLDKPDKVLSSEWDMIYVAEATDLDLVDWETLGGRLRAGRVPFQQLAGDCNPGSPHHFLYKRHQAGLLKLYSSRHQDNPRYFDRVVGEWTEEGKTYLARLERMTGNRRDRFLKGLWVAAEGVVYAFDPDVHQLPVTWEPPASWPRVWGIDWGESSPTVLGLWAVDPEGRLYHYREVYQTHLRADKLGAWCKREIESGREPRPHAIVCDHDLEKKADFELGSGLALTLAEKSERDKGIQEMQARFDVQDDGKPRIFLKARSLSHEPDRALVDTGRPCNSIEEVVGYVWNPDFLKDEPIADNDHWCFVAGTMVETASGPRPIESITAGDMVWTRRGLRPVLTAGMTSESAPIWQLEMSDGRIVEGTASHPIYTHNRGFVRMDEVRYNDVLSDLSENASWKFNSCPRRIASFGCDSMGSSIVDTRPRNVRRIETTLCAGRATAFVVTRDFTAIFGPQSTDQFLTGTTLTTSTATHSTTTSGIFKRFQKWSTKPSMPLNQVGELVPDGRPCLPNNSRRGLTALQSGTVRKLGVIGMPGIPRKSCSTCLSWMPLASDAELFSGSNGTARDGRDSAGTTARQPRDEIQGSTTRRGPVSTVEPGSVPIATRGSSFAGVRATGSLPGSGRNELAPDAVHCSHATYAVPSGTARIRAVRPTGRSEPVFNLTVDGEPEFYANGVLVHNCDQGRYVCVYAGRNFAGARSTAHRDAYAGDLSGKRMPSRGSIKR